MKYIYPKLFGKDLLFIRLGGNGLANCMLVAGRAAVLANRYGADMLRPTWERFSFSNYIRLDKDKRTYRNLFRGGGFLAPSYQKCVFWLVTTTILRRSKRNLQCLQKGY